MAINHSSSTETRAPLSRLRVLAVAVDVADRAGLKSLTMRNLANELGVEAMSLYHHVANKEDLLDGVVDLIVGEIRDSVAELEPPTEASEWKAAIRRQVLAARSVLLKHPWAPSVLETRASASPQVLMYFDSLVGLMRTGGFSYDLAHHALHALGSRALGFSQELFAPADGGDDDEVADMEVGQHAPYLVEMLNEISHDDPDSTLGWCDDQAEFEFGLDVILDGLEKRLST
jgi:AcrR family transcriptional regulator